MCHVVPSELADINLILSWDFLAQEKITLYIVQKQTASHTQLLLSTNICYTVSDIESLVEDIEINFDNSVKKQLDQMLVDVEKIDIPIIENDYSIKWTYGMIRFMYMHQEDLHYRNASKLDMDDLLDWIIQVSSSPYCARIISVKKRNGDLRLCVDLRLLNARIQKQKYPISLVEDCLAKLTNKSVFTLLNLKDDFHQIKVHPNSTKYFPFATPDAQYEYAFINRILGSTGWIPKVYRCNHS